MADRFYIGPFDTNSGMQTNYKPFLIPDEAFAQINNAYVFRGRIRKRFGSRWLGDQLKTRLRIKIGTTDPGTGNFTGFVPRIGNNPIATPAIGQMFSIGDEVYTVSVLGTPANLLRTDGIVAVATFDTSSGNPNSGQVIINTNGAQLNVDVYYYPALPVMGLLSFEDSGINEERIIGFDTRFAYEYVNGWRRLSGETTANAARWTGNNAQFFWSCTWTGGNAFQKVFFVTNFNETEPNFMRRLENNLWDNFRPKVSNLVIGPPLVLDIYLDSARIIVPFKNRLVMFNTWESESSDGIVYNQRNYPNRCRYSQIGSPVDALSFRQDIPGRGNAIDCPTTEQIVTVEFIKDRLIVYFERSTWELVYTGNQAYPFAWQQINTELGAESTFSIVPFDKVAIGVGNVGIMACNGINVERIDDKIPDTVFDIHNVDEGVYRVYGIRDYTVEMIYWTFPDLSTNTDFPYPNRVLVYNYKTGTWAFNDDSITCFGYLYQPLDLSVTWDSTTVTWDDDESWDGTSQQVLFRQVIAGNQEGFTFIVDPDATTNCQALQITDITAAGNAIVISAIDHNLRNGDFIYLTNIEGTGNITDLNNKIYEVIDASLAHNFSIISSTSIAGTYNGGGLIARVSQINILTKEYNFYAKQGRNAYISRIDFAVNTTAETAQSQFDVNFFVSTSTVPLLQDASGTGTLLGSGTLDTYPYSNFYPIEATSSRLIHPVYFQAEGEYIQLQITMNNNQMTRVIPVQNPDGSTSYTGPTFVDFQLHFMLINAQPTSYRFQ